MASVNAHAMHTCVLVHFILCACCIPIAKETEDSALKNQPRRSPLTNAGRVVLGKARRTFTGEATDGVDTQKLAVVLLCGALIEI